MKIVIIALVVLVLMIGVSAQSAFAELSADAIYNQGFKEGYNDAITGIVHHHLKTDDPDTTWAEGYFAGVHQGCVYTGRDNCEAQMEANTP